MEAANRIKVSLLGEAALSIEEDMEDDVAKVRVDELWRRTIVIRGGTVLSFSAARSVSCSWVTPVPLVLVVLPWESARKKEEGTSPPPPPPEAEPRLRVEEGPFRRGVRYAISMAMDL